MKNVALTLALIPALAALPACRSDEAAGGYGSPERVWVLEQINGEPFTARANITFPEPGMIAGQAPCNRYFGPMTATYPAFDASATGSTRMACPDLDAEGRFLKLLTDVNHAEVTGNVMLLSNDAGDVMQFKAE